MSLIKVVGFQVDGHEVSFELSQKKTIYVKGQYREHIMYIMESLLARDGSGYYWDLDTRRDAKYKEVEGKSYILFNDGGIMCQDKVVQVNGLVPNIHVIRYTGQDYTFRSFYLQNGLSEYSPIYTDMRKYSHVFDDAKWVRLMVTLNDLLGFEFVRRVGDELQFSPNEASEIPVKCQEFMYMLMAECYLTPGGTYSRVLLLSVIPGMPKTIQQKFIQRLGEIPGATLTMSSAPMEITDIKDGTSITFLST